MKERIRQIVSEAYGERGLQFQECSILTSEESYLVIITCEMQNFTHENVRIMKKIKRSFEANCLRIKCFRMLKNFIVMELFPFEYEGT